MESTEKPIITKIKENKLSLLMFILSLIQGMAFTRLVELTINILRGSGFNLETLNIAIHAILCFLIIIRLFETVFLGFLEYDEVVTSFYEVIMIFLIGAFEYWVIDSLSGFNPYVFYFRITILSIVSLVGYTIAMIKISGKKNRRKIFRDLSSFRRELKLHVVNITVPTILFVISILITNGVFTNVYSLVIIAGVISILVIINILVSWVMTLKGPDFIIPWDYNPIIETPGENIISEQLNGNILIKEAAKSDILRISELYLSMFSYVFRDIFETSDKIILKILAKIFLLNGGRSFYGYKNIRLARDSENNTIAGFVAISDSRSKKFVKNIPLGLVTIFQVFYFTGLWGVFRLIRNSWRNRKANPSIKESELYISYIGVLPEFRRIGIARKLLYYTEQIAISNKKTSVSLDVREDNLSAINLFLSQGFKEMSKIDDGAFHKSKKIRLSKEI